MQLLPDFIVHNLASSFRSDFMYIYIGVCVCVRTLLSPVAIACVYNQSSKQASWLFGLLHENTEKYMYFALSVRNTDPNIFPLRTGKQPVLTWLYFNACSKINHSHLLYIREAAFGNGFAQDGISSYPLFVKKKSGFKTHYADNSWRGGSHKKVSKTGISNYMSQNPAVCVLKSQKYKLQLIVTD